jgi:hypothetical protein
MPRRGCCKRTGSKQAAQKVHCKRRFYERYGIPLTDEMLADAVDQIQHQKGKYMGKQSFRLSIWQVMIAEQECIVIYDRERHSIVTCMPPGSLPPVKEKELTLADTWALDITY